MKIYIASRWSNRTFLHVIRRRLNKLQHQVVSSWLDEVDTNDFSPDSDFHRRLAIRDMVEISSANLLILDETEPLVALSGGGREVEYGFALGQFQNTATWLVGKPRNPFHFLAGAIYPSWNEVFVALGGTPDAL
jgi:hypothetical protein